VLSAPIVASLPEVSAPVPGVPPTAAVPAPPVEGTAAVVTEGSALLLEQQPAFFSVMLLDGQPIEFPVEMIGVEQDLGNGPIILQPNGHGV
jgi:hypothetical protein